ncbi:dual specificity protein phosphatase MPK-4-like [Phymastichus coffea]|uniref:dual specificity protein phosphatase MPK-4-like n=1 Tax=Phymastichus coffea TaxID=108790 RepID=UPI00273C4A02|nr:dual specificity protein phosphatase MPK-4-like [Phymastichus coffea]XP_058791768.1 dual specificity protein phosphatase MPK-4-like [Phymastichus coffea]XP_058791769.1 dual specificity protein phosphatase MPK-4-like [Phymastichus coffea]XP_058791770.1 dual specificity protein phosphatase MPK-4-like [Phymastichus coffea]
MMAKQVDDDLTREDFDAGPSSYDEIELNLYLGNLTAATDIDWLKQAKITHILTVDSCPLPRKIEDALPDIKLKYMQMTDMPREDLLTSFEDSNQFIQSALKSGGKILVHCYFGISRSATIVIAFIMKKYNLSYNDAFEAVKKKRRFVGPNPGFIAQLKLYEDMDFTLDCTNVQFKMFQLQIAADKVRKARILPQNYIHLIKSDPALPTTHPEPTVYRCKKCRRIVANASNILPHRQGEKQIWRHVSKRYDKMTKTTKIAQKPIEAGNKEKEGVNNELCNKTYFVEPLAWMPNILHKVDGKLCCPKCASKLGSFSWISGCQCPCGSKIAPAFYLVPSKVDWSNAVQNVQSTV